MVTLTLEGIRVVSGGPAACQSRHRLSVPRIVSFLESGILLVHFFSLTVEDVMTHYNVMTHYTSCTVYEYVAQWTHSQTVRWSGSLFVCPAKQVGLSCHLFALPRIRAAPVKVCCTRVAGEPFILFPAHTSCHLSITH
jgi:hypothetical protein